MSVHSRTWRERKVSTRRVSAGRCDGKIWDVSVRDEYCEGQDKERMRVMEEDKTQTRRCHTIFVGLRLIGFL